MSIEKVIRQKQFQNEFVKVEINILYTAGWIENFSNKFFKEFDISMQQYNVLRILRGQHPKPVKLSTITERMIDRMSNATRLVEKLRQKGLLSRELNQDNRRQVDILISDAGLSLLKEIDSKFHTVESKFKRITEEEAQELNRILDKMRGDDDDQETQVSE
jgi:DNA-binding MarR family transcriptional regulator